MAEDRKKALRDMMNGVVSDASLAFASKTVKVEQTAEAKSPTPHGGNKSQPGGYGRLDEDRYDKLDLMAEARKKLDLAKKQGFDSIVMEDSPLMEQKVVPTDAISLLLAGKSKEAKRVVEEASPLKDLPLINEENDNSSFDPLAIYSAKTKNAQPLIKEEQEYSKKSSEGVSKEELKSIITEILFDDMVGEGKFKKMIMKIMKDEMKPMLKQILLELKK